VQTLFAICVAMRYAWHVGALCAVCLGGPEAQVKVGTGAAI
jgi:hypothetical protein